MRDLNYIEVKVQGLDKAKIVAGEWVAEFNQIVDERDDREPLTVLIIEVDTPDPEDFLYIVRGFYASGTPFSEEGKSNAESVCADYGFEDYA